MSLTEEQRRTGGEYNFAPVDFAKVVEDLGRSEVVVKAAASCGTDLAGYLTTEGPGLSAFTYEDDVVYHTYSVYAPDAILMLAWTELLERTPSGDDAVTAIRRRDEYEGDAAFEGSPSL